MRPGADELHDGPDTRKHGPSTTSAKTYRGPSGCPPGAGRRRDCRSGNSLARRDTSLADRIEDRIRQRCRELSLKPSKVARPLDISQRKLHCRLASRNQAFGVVLISARVALICTLNLQIANDRLREKGRHVAIHNIPSRNTHAHRVSGHLVKFVVGTSSAMKTGADECKQHDEAA